MGALVNMASIAVLAMTVSNETEDPLDLGVTQGMLLALAVLHDGVGVGDDRLDDPAALMRRGLELVPEILDRHHSLN